MAGLVVFGVERGRAAAGPAPGLAVADLVGLFRDGAPDPAPTQVSAVGAGPVGLVCQHPVRAGARPPPACPGDPDAPQHDLELRAVAALPGGDDHGERFLALLAGQVHLGGQPAAGPAQAVISRLGLEPAGGLGLQIPPLACPGRVLVRPRHRGVHRHVPGDQPGRIGAALQGGEDLPPGAAPLPAAEQAVDRLPRPVRRRHVPPRRARPGPPPDPVDELPFHTFRRAARLLAARQQRLQHRPLRVRQVRPPRHR
jgi:hypothetical protein